MKRNIFVIALLAIVCFGCGREEKGEVTQRGKEIYDTWSDATITIMNSMIEPAFNLNAWLLADTDSARYAIEDLYFPNSKIRPESDSVYGIYNASVLVMRIHTHGQLLADAGANWTIESLRGTYCTAYCTPDMLRDAENAHALQIANVGNGDWKVSLDSATCEGSTGEWTLTLGTCPASLKALATYTMEFSGNYCFNYQDEGVEQTMLSYATTQTIGCGEDFAMTSGTMTLKAVQAGQHDVDVTVGFAADGVYITYRGVNEFWENDNDEYYVYEE